jgi:hypothetical protein
MLAHSLFYILLVILTNLLREHDILVSFKKHYPHLELKKFWDFRASTLAVQLQTPLPSAGRLAG